jgi:ubiquinone/menaquinone biosynthesis C-methylase UbiE
LKAVRYRGRLEVVEANVQDLEFPDNSFDTVVTSCTFCSVPDPVQGLKEIRRVLKPDGQMLMFEHVRPGNFLLGAMMDLITPIVRKRGPELNRPTADNIRRAGFKITREFNVYLDMVKLFEAAST